MRELDIGRGVLDQDLALEPVLYLADMLDHAMERGLVIRKRQQIVEVGTIMGRPGEMFADHGGTVAGNDTGEAFQMVRIEPLFGADRQPHAMDGQRHGLCHPAEHPVRVAARAHVVFGMDLEEGDLAGIGQDRLHVLWLEAGPGPGRQRFGTGVAGVCRGGKHDVTPVWIGVV